MTREEIILAAFAAGEKETVYSPVKVQKLFFLIDRNLAEYFGGKFFNFEPYHYGPFDKEVYTELNLLKEQGEIETFVSPDENFKKYKLSEEGRIKGLEIYNGLDPIIKAYIAKLNYFVTTLSFTELVGTIYKEYPDMKVNSIFSE